MIDKKAFAAITDNALAHKQGKRAPHTLDLPPEPLLIQHEIRGEVIAQRPADGYINATAMCKMAGKQFSNYRHLETTKKFLVELSAVNGIPLTAIIHTIRGGNAPQLQGTFVHPKVAIHLAQWLSPEFAVMVTEWVFEWMSGRVSGNMPSHLRRYVANLGASRPTTFQCCTS